MEYNRSFRLIGHYVYLDASGGKGYSIANLQGPLIRKSAATCQLTFWWVGLVKRDLDLAVKAFFRFTTVG